MKAFKFITALLCLALFSSCKKEPEASFSTDRTTYYVGETILLKNTSVDAKSYRWDFPEGTSSAEKDASYIVTNDFTGEPVEIILNASKKNGKKTSTASKSFIFSQPIFPGDYYQISKTSKPYRKHSKTENGLYKVMLTEGYKNPTELTLKLTINFKGGTRPNPGVYSTSDITFYVENEYGAGNMVNFANTAQTSDTVTVSQAAEGRLRVTFNNIKMRYQQTPQGAPYNYLSGDITF